MSPVTTAVNSVRAAVGSFHPGQMPPLSRALYGREMVAWLFLPVMMGAVEGGVTGVIAKNAFADVVPTRTLDLVVAILSGAPAFANVLSFVWASLAHGRHKIRFLVGLQIATALLVGQIALAPANGWGLTLLVVGAVGARMTWSGVVTLRSAVWRANYPQAMRARISGKIATLQAVILGSVALTIAWAMQHNPNSFHVLYPVLACIGGAGAIFYGRLRMRGHRSMIADERRDSGGRPWINPTSLARILRDDRLYRNYMIVMSIFGLGNLMMTAPFIIMLKDVFGFGYLDGIIITSVVPLFMMPLSIPLWSRLLDRRHIVHFRAIHAWTFVLATITMLAGALGGETTLLWIAAGLKGLAFGGGVLGWNLGHHDFSTAARSSQYMGVHVTLTGLRGAIGPILAVQIYSWFATAVGNGGWVFAVCLVLNLIGAWGFLRMARTIDRSRGSLPTR